MIPPVEERSVRPCHSCVFYRYDDGRDDCDIQFDEVNRPDGKYSRLNVFSSDEQHILDAWACKHHYTSEETVEHFDTAREYLIELLRHANMGLHVSRDACEFLGHPPNDDDNYQNMYYRCFCREKKYLQEGVKE